MEAVWRDIERYFTYQYKNVRKCNIQHSPKLIHRLRFVKNQIKFESNELFESDLVSRVSPYLKEKSGERSTHELILKNQDDLTGLITGFMLISSQLFLADNLVNQICFSHVMLGTGPVQVIQKLLQSSQVRIKKWDGM